MSNIVEDAVKNSATISQAPNARTPAKPEYIRAPGDNVVTSENNNIIVLGKDRVGPPGSGNDIRPLNSSAITLCAGLGTAIKNQQIPLDSKATFSNGFYYESAIVYVSEQTDVDRFFNCGSQSENSKNSSAVVLKADEVRLLSRGQIKLITGVDQMDSSVVVNDPNAPSHPKRDFSGISLIANNDETDVQPIVKGLNLEDFLVKLLDELQACYGVITNLAKSQADINDVIKNHTHMSDFTGAPLIINTDPAMLAGISINQALINVQCSNEIHTRRITNIESLRKNYLVKNPKTYINSTYNKTN